ncbi:hypothetical protein J6590_029044 [Homalodisca vitripennis]|nr:hypothetical protein J6590_029044 [Homalodisca vitripennis]
MKPPIWKNVSADSFTSVTVPMLKNTSRGQYTVTVSSESVIQPQDLSGGLPKWLPLAGRGCGYGAALNFPSLCKSLDIATVGCNGRDFNILEGTQTCHSSPAVFVINEEQHEGQN